MDVLKATFLGIAIVFTVMLVLALATLAWGQVLKFMAGYDKYTKTKKSFVWCFVVGVVLSSWGLYLLVSYVA